LIVVASIGILAAIAVPNFLEAQVRAKVAKAKSEIRTVATALELYQVDQNDYPFDMDSRGWPWYITDVITSPIAYVSNASSLIDPFRPEEYFEAGRRYRFVNYESGIEQWPPSPFPGPYFTRWCCGPSPAYTTGLQRYGRWKMSSAGPDQTAGSPFIASDLPYDASNGTISDGDIIRSQKSAEELAP